MSCVWKEKPVAAAEEARTTRSTPQATAASSTLTVPITLSVRRSAGAALPGPGTAAKWMIASWPAQARRRPSASIRSPPIQASHGSTGAVRLKQVSRCVGARARRR